MRIPRFYIIQYMSFTAIVALTFAIVVGRRSESTALALVILILVGLSPVLVPLLPSSVESALLKLPDDPSEQIAVLERVIAQRAAFRAGPRRSARLRLMQLYKDQERFQDALSLGRATLAQCRMPALMESQVRLDLSICLEALGRDAEARAEQRIASGCVVSPPVDALGWLVQGRLLDASHRYDEAVAAYECALRRPLCERKVIQKEAYLRLSLAYVKAGRPQETMRWAELSRQWEASRSGKRTLHQLAAKAYSSLGLTNEDGSAS